MDAGMAPDAARFERWLRGQPGFGAASVVEISLANGGASNLTCRVGLTGGPLRAVCLRVQRQRGIFEPYDVVREARVVACLARSAVPVPGVVGVEPAAAVLGAPFAVFEWVDAPHMGEAGAEADFGAFVRAVGAVHAVDWRELGLEFLGTPDSAGDALRGELDAVGRRMASWGLGADGLLAPALARLHARVPGDGRLALCQGDINVFNYLFRQGEVVAVVDWEQARISDPRSDVAHMLALSLLKGAPFGPADEAPFTRAYAQATGTVLHGMAFFRARWLLELGAIYHGWRAFSGSDPWYTWEAVADNLARALAEME